MANALSNEQIDEFKKAFSLIDKEGRGTITSDGLGNLMKSLGQPKTDVELKDLINEVNADGSGEIDLPEFITMMALKVNNNHIATELREAFQFFSNGRNDFISVDDLRYVMKNLGEELNDDEIAEMIRVADLDGDGQVKYDDFVAMISSKS